MILLLGVFQTFNDCRHREVHNQPRNNNGERDEIALGEHHAAAGGLIVVPSQRVIGVVVDAVNLVTSI